MNRNGKRDIIQIEEAYEAVVGTPPGKKAAKNPKKAGKSSCWVTGMIQRAAVILFS